MDNVRRRGRWGGGGVRKKNVCFQRFAVRSVCFLIKNAFFGKEVTYIVLIDGEIGIKCALASVSADRAFFEKACA